MSKLSVLSVLLALGACSALPPPAARPVNTTSACAASETSYACQVERYNNVNAQ
jgi:hypothetical protein